ncbi:hypothetical protein [Vibrio cionasavignyae]|uniref:hypothetical protein n=1 Tax=Vibrio cionasavignyae TaxID=2910252 RepID=UPI003D113CFB
MSKAHQITEQLESEVTSNANLPLLGKLMAPVRLCLVWMKLTNERLQQIENDLNPKV